MTSEFSKSMDIEALLGAPAPVEIKPAKANLPALAKRVEVLDVKNLSATFEATGEGPGIIRLEGKIKATLMQECARTLEEIETRVEDSFSLLLMRQDTAEQYLADQEEEVLEDIEILEGETVDLGEIATQYLSLAIDRFPVKEGAALESPGAQDVNVASEEEDKAGKNPFAALKNLHKKG